MKMFGKALVNRVPREVPQPKTVGTCGPSGFGLGLGAGLIEVGNSGPQQRLHNSRCLQILSVRSSFEIYVYSNRPLLVNVFLDDLIDGLNHPLSP